MKVIFSKKDWAKLGAHQILKELGILARTKDKIILGIVGGRSVVPLYDALSHIPTTVWRKVHIFLVDERQVPLEDEESNFNLAYHYLHWRVPDSNFHPYHYDKGVDVYNKFFKKHAKKFDILILSSGEDGHIGALYPNHHSILSNKEGFFSMDDSPKPPQNKSCRHS